jgi:hypothetical protein
VWARGACMARRSPCAILPLVSWTHGAHSRTFGVAKCAGIAVDARTHTVAARDGVELARRAHKARGVVGGTLVRVVGAWRAQCEGLAEARRTRCRAVPTLGAEVARRRIEHSIVETSRAWLATVGRDVDLVVVCAWNAGQARIDAGPTRSVEVGANRTGHWQGCALLAIMAWGAPVVVAGIVCVVVPVAIVASGALVGAAREGHRWVA